MENMKFRSLSEMIGRLEPGSARIRVRGVWFLEDDGYEVTTSSGKVLLVPVEWMRLSDELRAREMPQKEFEEFMDLWIREVSAGGSDDEG